MSVDTELDTWRREWQSEKGAMPDLSAKVRSHSRFMWAMLAAEVLLTVLMAGTTTAWAIRSPEPDVIVFAGAVWLFIAVAWTFALRNRRGCWAPAALNALAYLDISIRRCHRGIAAAKFAVVFGCCELLFCVSWVYRRKSTLSPLSPLAFLTSPPMIVVWICTAAFAVFVIWYYRRKQAELTCLLKLQQALGGQLRWLV
ncbi:MAG: hypothetical protein H7039_03140 [Bryobacteraceae bacterium]|nr:hypothetical protein [Bryobacteraceae bacterium]